MANFVLIVWPVLAIMFFASLGRERGLIWATLVGYLFLPEKTAFDLPLLPGYDKFLSLSLGLVLGAVFFRDRRSWPDMAPPADDSPGFRRLLIGLFAVFCIGTIFTIQDNGYALVNGPRVRSGLSMRDFISMISGPAILMVPFFLAWRWLSDDVHHREILLAIMTLGLGYSLLALIEVRLSPQINIWVYGFFPHEWRQHIRGGGFRPVVFLHHGLWLGFFLFTTVMAAFALFLYASAKQRMVCFLAGCWLLLVLLVSRNLGAVLLVLIFLPCLFLSRRLQIRIAMVVTVIFLAFPAVRQSGILPLDGFLNVISSIEPARAQSLGFRFRNEDEIMARAAEKPLFGWGTWGRNRIIDDKGRDLTVPDGIWVIYISERGWVGYVCYFGMLAFGLLFLPRVARRRPVTVVSSALGLILAANLVYLIPNSVLGPVNWMIAGALAGLVQWRPAPKAEEGAPEASATKTRVPQYTRFPTRARGAPAPSAPLRRS